MKNLDKVLQALHNGELIAYPTESTWGLGVDATQKNSVAALNRLKGRPQSKSFIVLTHDLKKISSWIDWELISDKINPYDNWPGPITKIFPASKDCPEWLVMQNTIAIRISAHPVTQAICEEFDQPIISTSANRSGESVLHDAAAIKQCFGDAVSAIASGKPGGLPPTQIICLRSGKVIRAATPIKK